MPAEQVSGPPAKLPVPAEHVPEGGDKTISGSGTRSGGGDKTVSGSGTGSGSTPKTGNGSGTRGTAEMPPATLHPRQEGVS